MKRATALPIFLATLAGFSSGLRAGEKPTFDTLAGPFLEQYCLDCHDSETKKGDIALDDLSGVSADNVDTWKSIWEQVALKEMPPRDKKNQPALIDRLELSGWITGELELALKDRGGFFAHMHPGKGNHLDHDLLFGEIPKGLEPTSTPARIWRIHPQEHLTRLNELINIEPAYEPKRPGMRTHGDAIPANRDGEVKVYFGLDRVIGWVGGTAAYAAAITGFPAVLSTVDSHGLQNYPILYSVNGAEAIQIAATAEDILRFMAGGPAAEPYQFADNANQIDKKYKHESMRGLAQSLFYSKEPKRPLTPVYDLMSQPGGPDENLKAAVDFLFEALTFRPPSESESEAYVGILKEAIADLGKEEGAILGLVPIFLDRDALFRPELAAEGTPDEYGRVMLRDHELALAVNAAFGYIAPDETLKHAIRGGKMRTREDVRREVERILADDSIRKPRVLQFFREYFDYTRAGRVCKDMKALSDGGGEAKKHYNAMFGMTQNTDRLIEEVLREDKDVLSELLTTDRVVIDPGLDMRYYSEFEKGYSPPKKPEEESDKKKKKKKEPVIRNIRMAKLPSGQGVQVKIERASARYGNGLGGNPNRLLTTLPEGQRMGILTHPSWLVSHSDAMDNHAILRGRWVRERLLGDAVPDVPITVDAMLPDEPGTTLRHRMRVTREEYCWRCHQKMDPLGLPFEMFNHIGLYRKQELGKPVDTSGEIIHSGDPELDGPVDDALDMIRKLAKSERVKQVFVRHAFRYWMGRNESIHDAPVLQDAYKAYVENGGSMKALIASLVTSDAFLYRKVER